VTVEELIAELCEFQPELEVYVRGYEGGIDDIVQVSHVLVHRGKHVDEDMYGDHAVYEPEPQFEEPWEIEADTRRAVHGVQLFGKCPWPGEFRLGEAR